MTDLAFSKDMSLSEHVYAALKSRLMLGHYLPGDRLSMRKLAAEFGTSPMPVREALKHLASERVINSAAAKAFHVPELSDKRAADLFDLRALLECTVIDTVADTLNDKLIEELAALSERMEAHLKLRDHMAYLVDNQSFHFLIYDQIDNPDMIAMIEQLWMKTGPFLHQGMQHSDGVNLDWNADHKRLIAAMQAGDTARYSEIMRSDIAWGSDFYRD